MDARMQKHRMTRWVGRFLALLSLVMSCRVQATELLGSSGKRSKDPNNIFALGNLVRALVGLFLSSIPVQASAAWDAGAAGCFTSFQTAMAAVCAINNPDSTSIPGSVYYRDSCVMTSIPNFRVYAHAVNLATGNSFSFAYTLSLTQCDFTISLSGGTEVEPSSDSSTKTLPIIATVKNKSTDKPPAAPVEVHISLKVEPTSGGHDHGNSTRPRGGIAEKETCPTDDECWSHATDNGAVVFNFNPTDASGTHTITATCDGCSNTAMTKVDVKVPNLITMPSTPLLYSLIGSVEGKHTDNHYLTPPAVDVIWGIAADYHMSRTFWQPSVGGTRKLAPPPPLGFNDASLIWGGKFDLSGKWSGSHYEHHEGVVIDIRANGTAGSIPYALFNSFEELAAKQNVDATLECTSNKIDGQGRTPPSCIGKDGSSDQNRHYHVRINP